MDRNKIMQLKGFVCSKYDLAGIKYLLWVRGGIMLSDRLIQELPEDRFEIWLEEIIKEEEN